MGILITRINLTYSDEAEFDRKQRQESHGIRERVDGGPLAQFVEMGWRSEVLHPTLINSSCNNDLSLKDGHGVALACCR